VVSGRYPLEQTAEAMEVSASGIGVKYMIAPHD
jgi:hypothetical protein